MPPRLCPSAEQRDCPIYAVRLLAAQQDARLSRAIHGNSSPGPTLANLIRVEGSPTDRPRPALPVAPPPTRPISILDQLAKENRND
jgi:hypothetical protein